MYKFVVLLANKNTVEMWKKLQHDNVVCVCVNFEMESFVTANETNRKRRRERVKKKYINKYAISRRLIHNRSRKNIHTHMNLNGWNVV